MLQNRPNLSCVVLTAVLHVLGVLSEAVQRSYYDALELTKDASLDEIKKAYRKQALKWHPDKNKDPEASLRFHEVSKAYEILGDPSRRREYDGGSGGLDFDFPDFAFKDADAVFKEFFGDEDPWKAVDEVIKHVNEEVERAQAESASIFSSISNFFFGSSPSASPAGGNKVSKEKASIEAANDKEAEAAARKESKEKDTEAKKAAKAKAAKKAEQQKAENEQTRHAQAKAQADAAAKKKAEDGELNKQTERLVEEEKAAQKAAQAKAEAKAAAASKKAEDEEAKKHIEMKAELEKAARQRAEDEAKKEAQAKAKAEAEEKRRAEDEEARKFAAAKAQEEKAAQRADEEHAKKAKAEAELEARKKAKEEEARKVAAAKSEERVEEEQATNTTAAMAEKDTHVKTAGDEKAILVEGGVAERYVKSNGFEEYPEASDSPFEETSKFSVDNTSSVLPETLANASVATSYSDASVDAPSSATDSIVRKEIGSDGSVHNSNLLDGDQEHDASGLNDGVDNFNSNQSVMKKEKSTDALDSISLQKASQPSAMSGSIGFGEPGSFGSSAVPSGASPFDRMMARAPVMSITSARGSPLPGAGTVNNAGASRSGIGSPFGSLSSLSNLGIGSQAGISGSSPFSGSREIDACLSVVWRNDVEPGDETVKHVEGSACCNSAPISGATDKHGCCQRCVSSARCEVFVWQPSSGSCWLLHWTTSSRTPVSADDRISAGRPGLTWQ